MINAHNIAIVAFVVVFLPPSLSLSLSLFLSLSSSFSLYLYLWHMYLHSHHPHLLNSCLLVGWLVLWLMLVNIVLLYLNLFPWQYLMINVHTINTFLLSLFYFVPPPPLSPPYVSIPIPYTSMVWFFDDVFLLILDKIVLTYLN